MLIYTIVLLILLLPKPTIHLLAMLAGSDLLCVAWTNNLPVADTSTWVIVPQGIWAVLGIIGHAQFILTPIMSFIPFLTTMLHSYPIATRAPMVFLHVVWVLTRSGYVSLIVESMRPIGDISYYWSRSVTGQINSVSILVFNKTNTFSSYYEARWLGFVLRCLAN